MSFWRQLLIRLGFASVEAGLTPGTPEDKKAAIEGTLVKAGLEALEHGLEQAAKEQAPSTPKTPEEKAAAQKAKADKKAAKVPK